MSDKTWWYLARSGGLVSWWLLAASVLWGLTLSTRIAKGKATPAWLLDLHRFLGGLALVFTGVHILGLVADSWVHFGWAEVLVPFASTWRPAEVAAGVLALYLLVAVEVTSLAQKQIPRRWWRAIHSTSFLLFLAGSLHALTAGADVGHPAIRISAVLILVAFIFLLAYRAAVRRPRASAPAPSSGLIRSG